MSKATCGQSIGWAKRPGANASGGVPTNRRETFDSKMVGTAPRALCPPYELPPQLGRDIILNGGICVGEKLTMCNIRVHETACLSRNQRPVPPFSLGQLRERMEHEKTQSCACSPGHHCRCGAYR